MAGTPPPRISIITATASPHALILRRGPSRYTATIGWNRDTNEFTMGQWLRGKIDAYKSDLSPDGKYFMYFAGNGNTRMVSGGYWTAISRAPYLKAIRFWPWGTTYYGGGGFTGPQTYWLNGSMFSETLGSDDEVKPDADHVAFLSSTDGFHMGELHVHQLEKRGWVCGAERVDVYSPTLDKPIVQDWVLRKHFQRDRIWRRAHRPEYHSVFQTPDHLTRYDGWEWAEVWKTRVQFVEDGCLFTARISKKGEVLDKRCLKDFNGMTFENIRAPYGEDVPYEDRWRKDRPK